MDIFQTFEEFLKTATVTIPILSFTINLLLSALLALILIWIYTKHGTSLSNRKLFARNFLLMTMTTMLIITIVKSSLALSLGLVGALSIIRFRAAIKEPEELAYLFLAISIGLGFGANQGLITVIAFIIIIGIIIINKKMSHRASYETQNLHVTINSQNPQKNIVDKIIEILEKYCLTVNLRRLDENNEIIEVSFIVEFRNFKNLNEAKIALQQLDNRLKFTFLDNKGIF